MNRGITSTLQIVSICSTGTKFAHKYTKASRRRSILSKLHSGVMGSSVSTLLECSQSSSLIIFKWPLKGIQLPGKEELGDVYKWYYVRCPQLFTQLGGGGVKSYWHNRTFELRPRIKNSDKKIPLLILLN